MKQICSIKIQPNLLFDIRILEQIEGVYLYTGVKFWTFLTSKKGVNLYTYRLIRKYIQYL